MEALEVEETACLAGNKENRLAAMTVNLEFHIAVQIVRVIFEITNFHERYSFGQYKRKCACAASHRVKAFFPFSDGRQNKPISSGSNGKSGNLGFLAGDWGRSTKRAALLKAQTLHKDRNLPFP